MITRVCDENAKGLWYNHHRIKESGMNPDDLTYRARIQSIKFDVKRRLTDVTGALTAGSTLTTATQEPVNTQKITEAVQLSAGTVEGGDTSLEARIHRVASDFIDVSKFQSTVSGKVLDGQDMTDCLQQAVVVAEMAMNESAKREAVRFELERWVQSYRDTGGGGHETSAGIIVVEGESSQTLSLPPDQQAGTAPRGGAALVIRIMLVPQSDARQEVGTGS